MDINWLQGVFATAYGARRAAGGTDAECDRAGIAAVIRAVRDEMQFGDWTAWHRLNEILGDAGNEKVAGGSAREDEKAVEAAGDKGPVTVNSPATAPCPRCGYPAQDQCDSPDCNTVPAPAVCVWNTVAQGWECDIVKRSCTGSEFRVYGSGEHTCPSCKAPIKFTEAK